MKVTFFVYYVLMFKSVFGLYEEFPQALKEQCHEDITASIAYAEDHKSPTVSFVRFEKDRDDIAVFHGIVSFQFLKILENLPPTVKTLVLELPQGGHAIASVVIARKVRELGLNTYVGLTRCHSACTMIYQGGVERFIHPRGLLSYHGPSGRGVCLQETRKFGEEMLVGVGFSPKYLNVLVSFADVHFKTASDLLEMGASTQELRLGIGHENAIEKAWEAKKQFCNKNPEAEDC